MVRDLSIISGPSLKELRESLNKYLDGEKKEIFFRIVDTKLDDVGRAEKYVGQIVGLVACNRKEEGESAFVNVYGIVRREYDHYWHDLQINGYNTRKPSDDTAHIVKLKRRQNTNPKNKKKGKAHPRTKREKGK